MKNGFACYSRSGNEVRGRFKSPLPRRRMVPPAERHYPTTAVIPDFRGQTWQSLQDFPKKHTPACSDSGFHGVNLGIAARNCPEMSSCVQRFLISGSDLRITARFSPETHSNVQRFRISWGQFGNRCKESLRIASCCSSIPRPTLTFVAAQKNSPLAAQSCGTGGDRMP